MSDVLDERIRQLVREIVEAGPRSLDTAVLDEQPEGPPPREPEERSGRAGIVALVAAAVVVFAAAAVWFVPGNGAEPVITDPVSSTVAVSPSTSTFAVPEVSETAPSSTVPAFEPDPPSLVGYGCLDATSSYFGPENRFGSLEFESYGELLGTDLPGLPDIEFSELVLPAGEAGVGYVFLFVEEVYILCRTTGDMVEYVAVSNVDLPVTRNSEILGLGKGGSESSNFESGVTTKAFRVVGRASAGVEGVAIVLSSGFEATGVLHGGWFVIEAMDLPGTEPVLEEVSEEGSALLQWVRADGTKESASLFEIDGNGGPPNTTPFTAGVFDNLSILQRPLTEADALPDAFNNSGLGPKTRANFADARRGAERDGVVIWISPTDPAGGFCTFITGPEFGSRSSTCIFGGAKAPMITAGGGVDSESDVAYLAGLVLSEDIVEVIGAAMVDGTYVFTYNPDTYDGDRHTNGSPVLYVRLADGSVVDANSL